MVFGEVPLKKDKNKKMKNEPRNDRYISIFLRKMSSHVLPLLICQSYLLFILVWKVV